MRRILEKAGARVEAEAEAAAFLWHLQAEGVVLHQDLNESIPIQDGERFVTLAAALESVGQQEAGARLAAVVDATDVAIVGVDTQGRVSDWNQGAARMFGYARDEVEGRPIAEIIVPAERRDEDARVRHAVESGTSLAPFETIRQCKDGRRIRTSVTLSPILAPDGAVIGATAVERDVTQAHKEAASKKAMDLERAEHSRLKALEQMRQRFISDASHELNTPLTPVRIHLEQLTEDRRLTPDQREHVAVIERNVLRLCDLVRDMLEASRLDAGHYNLEFADVRVSALVGDAVDSLAESAKRHGVTLSVGPVAQLVARADRARIGQVLYNLLTNAISFTPEGGHVTVSTALHDQYAVVRVKDNGVGLTADQIAQLFQPFARPHEGTGSAPRGTGLGLFISRGIIEQHGGRIWAESPGPGQGSTFSFSLPLAVVSGAPHRSN